MTSRRRRRSTSRSPVVRRSNYYNWWDQYYYVQDEWRARNNLTLSLGLRYELSGNNIQSLIDLNESIVEANGGNRVFRLTPVPKTDKNNFQPRLGFNWSPRSDGRVARDADWRRPDGGARRVRTNARLRFPQHRPQHFQLVPVRGNYHPRACRDAFSQLQNTPAGLPPGDPNLLTRTVVADDFRAPMADQFSLEVQRQFASNVVARVGYVGTFGKDLFQTIDGNPRLPNSTQRVDPTRGIIRLRANEAESWYHSLQTGLEKRFSGGLGAGVHYTWSQYLDTASEVFNPSTGEVAVAQDSFDRETDKGRSSYDRPHRLTGNFVWELPWMRDQQGVLGKILGGWQLASFFTPRAARRLPFSTAPIRPARWPASTRWSVAPSDRT